MKVGSKCEREVTSKVPLKGSELNVFVKRPISSSGGKYWKETNTMKAVGKGTYAGLGRGGPLQCT